MRKKRRRDAEEILKALDRQDYEMIRMLGHRMKGDGGSYSLAAVSEIGAGLEQGAVDGDHAAIRDGVSALTVFLDRVQVGQREE